MRAAFPTVAVVLLAHLACARAAGSSPSTETAPAPPVVKVPPAPASPKASAATKPPVSAPPSGQTQVDGGLPQIEPLPLKEGKRVRIRGLRETRPLEITAAPDMRLSMNEQEELPPRASLKGRDAALEIFAPDGPWDSLAEILASKQLINTEIIHSQQLVRGYLIIRRKKSKWSPDGYRYSVAVSRPDLGVVCGDESPPFASRASIEKIASICLSLREVGSKQ